MTLTKPNYMPRLADQQLTDMLEAFGAVCIEGPKWCGKTWTALNQALSVAFIANPDNNFQTRTMAQLNPALILTGKHPRLIDEWQEVLPLWDAVRFAVDQQADRGQYILTGSATPNYKGVLHSGAGRIGRMRMRTMSLYESGDSDGSVSLCEILSGSLPARTTQAPSLEHLIALCVRGGWPGSLGLPAKAAAELPRAYLSSVIEDDIHRLEGIQRDRQKMWMLLRSLARNESTLATNATLRRDMLETDGETIHVETVAEYLNVLERMFLREDQGAFDPNMRSSVRVGKSKKRHFVDPSLAVAALGATPGMLLDDLNTFGFLFEALCERDLQIYASALNAQLFHYRDASGREIDAVIECEDGTWGAFEIKLGQDKIDEAAKHLLHIRQLMTDDPRAKPPAILCVICGLGEYAYTRADGVMVAPITSLKP